ncbi:MAG: hypothetical protein J0I32_23515 [Sphingobacteriales bacterium]|nr:hypothetical protein [Sphingobacteriales bacterium]
MKQTNPILYFREQSELKSSLNDEHTEMKKNEVASNNDSSFYKKISHTLITKTREAVDSSEHSDC